MKMITIILSRGPPVSAAGVAPKTSTCRCKQFADLWAFAHWSPYVKRSLKKCLEFKNGVGGPDEHIEEKRTWRQRQMTSTTSITTEDPTRGTWDDDHHKFTTYQGAIRRVRGSDGMASLPDKAKLRQIQAKYPKQDWTTHKRGPSQTKQTQSKVLTKQIGK